MAYTFPPAMRQLIYELSKLPSIGEKSATRLAYHLISRDASDGLRLSEAVKRAIEVTRLCEECFALSENLLCEICRDQKRARSVICIVEKPADVIALERSGGYQGLYHVLHGLWAPLKGVFPEHVRIRELVQRIERSQTEGDPTRPPVTELILATSTTVEGDATALFIADAVNRFGIKISRIAQGLPKGGELEYADEMTLLHALDGRQSMS